MQGKARFNFSSNDYLGLANDPEMVAAMQAGVTQFGCGSGASHLICGHLSPHQQLEQMLAEWLQCEAVTLFSSGYQANLAVLTTLLQKEDLLVQDKLNHASLIDAGLMTKATHRRFRHQDFESLQQQLQGSHPVKMIAVDGVFSMDGDIADLIRIRSIAEQAQATVYIDDAHGLGVLGPTGSGTVEHFELKIDDNLVMMGTMGKALGVAGAFVASNQVIGDALKQFARPYIYTTAIAPAVAFAACEAVKLIRQNPQRIQQLHHNIAEFKQLAEQYGITLLASDTAIQPVLIGDDSQCMSVANSLLQRGFLVGAIRPPTVPVNTSRLRITLSSSHDPAIIKQLVEALAQVLKEAGLMNNQRESD